MPSTVECVQIDAERAELQAVLQSQFFLRSPALSHLLSHLCEKLFAGESDQIKEYSIALDVFGRRDSFDQDTDSIVRVQANRLRKRLAEYYATEGAFHRLRITIPVGQYIPVFEEAPPAQVIAEVAPSEVSPPTPADVGHPKLPSPLRRYWPLWALVAVIVVGVGAFLARQKFSPRPAAPSPPHAQAVLEPAVGLPIGDEVRILAASNRGYVDRSGKQWSPDASFTGGTVVRSSVQHIWRTQDPAIYRSSREGDFAYDIPLKRGTYELRLHFAETFYGPEDMGGGGEGSRIMSVVANGKPLLTDFDVIADAGGGRTADVKVFTEITPSADGFLHLSFASAKSGRAMISAIEILPGARGHMRPVRIVARDVPYYSNDSQWWSADNYFKGGQLSASEEPAAGTDDPELYETERWGHFSYAIPVSPGRYNVTLHFIERTFHLNHQARGISQGSSASRIFNVFCNGKAIIRNLNILEEAGENRPLLRQITGLEPNAQGKLLLEFVPVSHYATVSAIEILPQ